MTLVAMLSLGRVADAQPAPPAASSATEPAPATDAKREEARQLHARGLALYDVGHFDEAIAAFKEAYALAPVSGLLFNIAQCYRAKGREGCADALHFYQTYLRFSPDAPNRDFVVARIADMEACERERQREHSESAAAAAPTGARDRAPPSQGAASSFPWGPVLIGAAGLAAAAAGVGLYVSSHDEYISLQDRCGDGRCPPSDWEQYRTRQQVGVALGIGGGVVVAASFAWWLLTKTSHRPTSSRVAIGNVGRF